MNGPLYVWEVFVKRYIEERVEVIAENEHEAITSIKGPKDEITYIKKIGHHRDEAEAQPRP